MTTEQRQNIAEQIENLLVSSWNSDSLIKAETAQVVVEHLLSKFDLATPLAKDGCLLCGCN
jgi:hypothetical protein